MPVSRRPKTGGMRGVVVVMRRLLLSAWSGRAEFWPWPVVGRAFGRIERGWRGYRGLRHGLCRDLLRPALPAPAFDVPLCVKQALEGSPLKFSAVRGFHPVIDKHLRDLRPGDCRSRAAAITSKWSRTYLRASDGSAAPRSLCG